VVIRRPALAISWFTAGLQMGWSLNSERGTEERMSDAVIENRPVAPLFREAPADDSIYRPFFKGSIVVVLSAGCSFGATNLFHMGRAHDFQSIPVDWTLAHAHAQILGWVGLFVMGFAYQAFPRFRQTRLSHPKLAILTLWLMIAGIALRLATQLTLSRQGALPYLMVSGALEIAAVTIFCALIGRTMHGRPAPGAAPEKMVGGAFIMTGLLVFWLQTALGPVIDRALAGAPDQDAFVLFVATWMGPFRDLQVLGFITMMIFGVSLRLLPAMFGTAGSAGSSPDEKAAAHERGLRGARRVYVLYAASLTVDMVCYVLFMRLQNPLYLLAVEASYFGMLTAAVMIVRLTGVFGPTTGTDRGLKFVRAAYGWLLFSFVMFAAMWPYNLLTGIGFSHAYLSGARHAITVGFISMMMMGMAARVVPMLRGLDARAEPSLWPAFILVNVGCALRVGLQLATDFSQAVYPLMGVSGFIEVAGVVWWAVEIWRAMDSVQERAPGAGSGNETAGIAVAGG